MLVWEAAIWEAAKVRVQAKLLYWKQHNNFAPGKGKALNRCPEPVQCHIASPEPKECVVPPVLAPGASADGGAACARVTHTRYSTFAIKWEFDKMGKWNAFSPKCAAIFSR